MAELVSTRDPAKESVGYGLGVLRGLAPDRGLYVPPNQLAVMAEEEMRRVLRFLILS